MLSNILPLDQKISFANIIRAIRASFALAALFSVFMVVCIGSFIDEGESDFRTIDLAGVQRTLSQKLAKDIYFTGIEGPPITQIKKDAELWDSIHNVLRYGSTAQDVTVLENARLRILRQYKELENFVDIISHNLRAPISTLQGLVGVFEPGNAASNAQIIEYVGTTVDALDRTLKDLNHALSLKDISEDRFGKVHLEDVIRDIEHLLVRDIRTSGARIEHDFSKAPKAFGVRSYFTDILYNLVTNSVKFRADDSPPRIRILSRPTALGAPRSSCQITVRALRLPRKGKKRSSICTAG